MDKVIDMSHRKGLEIIYPKKEEKEFKKNNAMLTLKTELLEDCSVIDPIGVCTVTECLNCKNCDYQVVLKDGTVIRDFSSKEAKGNEEKYVLEFFDDVDFSNFSLYLQNEESDYRITRQSDSVILRLTKEDVQKRDKSMNQSRSYITDLMETSTFSFQTEIIPKEVVIGESLEEISKKNIFQKVRDKFIKR